MKTEVTMRSVHCCSKCRGIINYCDNDNEGENKWGRFHKSFRDGDVVYCISGKHYCEKCGKNKETKVK